MIARRFALSFVFLFLITTNRANFNLALAEGPPDSLAEVKEEAGDGLPPEEVAKIPDQEIKIPVFSSGSGVSLKTLNLRDPEAVDRYGLLSYTASGSSSGNGLEVVVPTVQQEESGFEIVESLNAEEELLSSEKLEEAVHPQEIPNESASPESRIKTIRKIEGAESASPEAFIPGHLVADARFLVAENTEIATNIIEYYEGIENNTSDLALYYLDQNQNADGSFGRECQNQACSYQEKTERLKTTIAVLEALQILNYTANQKFEQATEYIRNFEAGDLWAKAQKVQGLSLLGEDSSDLIAEIILGQKSNGGFGRSEYHASSFLVSLDVAQAFALSGYRGPEWGEILSYLEMRQNSDGGFPYTVGVYNTVLPLASSDTLTALTALWLGRYQTTSVIEKNILEKTLNYLQTKRSTAGFFGNENQADALATVLAVLALQKNQAAELFVEDLNQFREDNGSIADDVYLTALSLMLNASADIALTDLQVPEDLITGTTTEITVTVENVGTTVVNAFDLIFYRDNCFYGQWPVDLRLAIGETAEITIEFETHRFIEDEHFRFLAKLPDETGETNLTNNVIAKDLVWTGLPGPYAPALFGVSTLENGQVSVHILASESTDAVDYLIYYGRSSRSYDHVAVAVGKGGIISGLEKDVPYYFSAAVRDTTGQLSTYFSPEVKVIPRTTPPVFNITGTTTDNLEILPEVSVNKLKWYLGQSESSGDFTLSGLTPGTYLLKAAKDGYAPQYRAVSIAEADAEQINLDLFLAEDPEPPVIELLELRNGGGDNFDQFKTGHSYQIIYAATDNTAVKTVDLFYSLNDGEDWQPIVENLAYEGSVEAYNWVIPDQLTTSGLIKIKATDYRENSAELTGSPQPFTVVSGIAPTASILSPQGGETWPVGQEQLIQWTAPAESELSYVKIYLKYGDNKLKYVGQVEGSTSQYLWKIPQSSYYLTDTARIVLEVADSNYNTARVESESFAITDVEPVWDNISQVTNLAVGQESRVDRRYIMPVAAVGADGRIHMVYKYEEDDLRDYLAGSGPRYYTQQLLYQVYTPTTNTWTSAQTVFTRTDTDETGGLTGVGLMYDLQIALDANQNLSLAWQNYLQTDSGYEQDIFYLGQTNGQWGTAQNISHSSTRSIWPKLRPDETGTMYLLWKDKNGSKYQVHSRARTGGNWGATQYLTDDTASVDNFAVDISDSSHWHMAYDRFFSGQGYLLNYQTGNASGWGSTQFVDKNNIDGYLVIQADQNQKSNVVWSNEGRKLYFNTNQSGQFLAESELIVAKDESLNENFQKPILRLNSEDQAFVVFEDYSGRKIYFTSRKEANHWLAKTGLSPASQSPENAAFEVVTQNNESTGFVFWDAAHDGHREIYFTQRPLQAELFEAPAEVSNFMAETSNSSVRLSFAASPGPDILKYLVYQKNETEIGGWELVTELSATTTEYLQTGLVSNQDYTFKISVVNSYGVESSGSVLDVKTDGEPLREKILYYDFNEETNEVVPDLSGHNLDGSLGDGNLDQSPTWTAEGISGGAYYFNGQNNLISIPDTELLDLSDQFTLEGWFYLDEDVTGVVGGGGHSLFSKWNSYALRVERNRLVGVIWPVHFMPSIETAAEQWHQIVMTFDGVQMRLFQDGQFIQAWDSNLPAWNNNPIWIGANQGGGRFKGKLDELSIYNYVLADSTVAANYAQMVDPGENSPPEVSVNLAGDGGGGLVNQQLTAEVEATDADNDSVSTVLDWRRNGASLAVLNLPFNEVEQEPQSFKVKDYSTFDNQAVFEKQYDFYNKSRSDGIMGGAYYFDGEDDGVEVAPTADLDVGSDQDFSWEVWIKPEGSQPNYAGLLSKADRYNNGGGLQLFLHKNTLGAELISNQYFVGVADGLKGTTVLNDDEWYQVVVVAKRAEKKLEIYLNGQLEIDFEHDILGQNLNSPRPLYIGKERMSSISFQGLIDEVRVYKRALSLAQISLNYNYGQPNYLRLAAAELKSGENWSVQAVAHDGKVASAPVISPAVTVEKNTAPLISQADLQRNEDGSLGLQVQAADLNADPVAVNVDWRQSGTSMTILNLAFNAQAVKDYSSYENTVTVNRSSRPGGSSGSYGTKSIVYDPKPVRINSGIIGGAYQFDGQDDRILASVGSEFDFGSTQNFTLSTWIKTAANNPNYAGLIVKAPAEDGKNGYQLVLHENKIAAEIMGNENFLGVQQGLKGSTVLNDNKWHQVVLAVDRPAQKAILYVDGQAEAELTDSLIQENLTNNNSVFIGKDRTSTLFFNGQMDEVRIYDRALSAEQINVDYNQGQPNYQVLSQTEINPDEVWSAQVVASDGYSDSSPKLSSEVSSTTVADNVQGQVVDNNTQNGLEAVLIEYQGDVDGQLLTGQTQTTSEGQYSLNLPPGQYTFSFRKEAYLAQEVLVGITASGSNLPASLALSPGLSLSNVRIEVGSGQVVNDLGFAITVNFEGPEDCYILKNKNLSLQEAEINIDFELADAAECSQTDEEHVFYTKGAIADYDQVIVRCNGLEQARLNLQNQNLLHQMDTLTQKLDQLHQEHQQAWQDQNRTQLDLILEKLQLILQSWKLK